MKFSLDKSIEILFNTPQTLTSLLQNLSEEWINHNEGENTWTVKEIVAHLIVCEQTNWMTRVKLILSENENKTFALLDMKAHFELAKQNSIDDLLKMFKEMRMKGLEELKSFQLQGSDLQKTGIHPATGEVPLQQIIATWTAHDLTHIAQIARVMAKQQKESMGSFAKFFKSLNYNSEPTEKKILINHSLILEGKYVKLVPLEYAHFDELIQLAQNELIWQHYTINGGDAQKLKASLESAFLDREKGTQYTFVIFSKADNRIVGSTRYMDIQQEHKKLEIGWTWLHPDAWGTKINLECKFLLMQYGFEVLRLKRIQLKTDESNMRSRKAIAKIGGQFEGILRNDMERDNGMNRNSVYFSILDREWESVKENLLILLES